MSWKKGFILAFVLLFFLVAGYAGRYVYRTAPVGSAFSAKLLCSGVFISGLPLETLISQEIAAYSPDPRLIRVEVDETKRMVTTSFLGVAPSSALYREGTGCTLLAGHNEDYLHAQFDEFKTAELPPADTLPWPSGDRVTEEMPEGIDTVLLDSALAMAFSEPDSSRLRRTRAVVVVYDGQIIAERYAPEISRETPLLGWSMTKSVTNALVGILVGEGRLSLDQPVSIEARENAGNPRQTITLGDLMHMSSGLQFDENYGDVQSDVVRMLYDTDDAAAFAASFPVEVEPGSHWEYSSGTTNIISKVVRDAIEATSDDHFSFPRRALFDRIGMRSAVLEPDASGTFVGSSFMYATARDWARFGLLYLWDGVWKGERILPEGWVTYSTTPAPAAPNGQYGAQFWLNGGDTTDPLDRPWPTLPPDTYVMRGHDGQSVTIIPSMNTVIVRLGLSHGETTWDQDAFLNDVLSALPEDCAPVALEEECSI